MGYSVLVAYATKSGSTGEVAQAIGRRIRDAGVKVDVRAAREVTDLGSYAAVVVGSPVLYGKPHTDATRFLERHQKALSHMPVAAFLTCLELTTTEEDTRRFASTYVDPMLGRSPAAEDRLTYFEKTHLLSAFVKELLGRAPQVRPVSVGVFRGSLDYHTLDWISRLVMRLIWLIYRRAPEGDFRNWEAIESWADRLPRQLLDLPHKPRRARRGTR